MIRNCCTVVGLLHLSARFFLIAGIGRPSATCYKQSRSSMTVYSARPTKCGLTLYTFTVVRELCMTPRCDVMPKTTEENQIVRTGKSEAEI